MDERLRFVARLLDGEKMAAAVRGVRDLPQDRLQDLRSLQGLRPRRADRSQPAAVSARQSAADGVEKPIVPPEEGVSELGRAEDPREAAAAAARGSSCRRSARCTRCSIGTAW